MSSFTSQVDEIVRDALLLPAIDRAKFIESACACDQLLLKAVNKKLAEVLDSDPKVDSLPQTRSHEPSQSGERLPVVKNYKILQKIGSGGMGKVYMADQVAPVKRRVAIKVVSSDTPTKEILGRFQAERQALAMMDHQNIAKVLDVGVTETGRPYFAMELVKGISIMQYCDQNRLSTNERLELFVQVCRAIQHAHQKGVIHRDLKPSNVLVTLYDGKPAAKVIDFGLAKAIHDQTMLTEKTVFTRFGAVVGTLLYMSPEQAEMNALDVDTRTDVYSLGVILYELLTGSTPVEQARLKSEALDQILQVIREEDPPRPSIRLSSSGNAITAISEQRRITPSKLQQILRGELDWIVMKALEKDRSRRYETVNGLASDVQRYLSDEPIVARPPSKTYRIRKFVKKNRAFVSTASVAITMTLIGLLAAIGWLNSRLGQANAELELSQERQLTWQLGGLLLPDDADENVLHWRSLPSDVMMTRDDFGWRFHVPAGKSYNIMHYSGNFSNEHVMGVGDLADAYPFLTIKASPQSRQVVLLLSFRRKLSTRSVGKPKEDLVNLHLQLVDPESDDIGGISVPITKEVSVIFDYDQRGPRKYLIRDAKETVAITEQPYSRMLLKIIYQEIPPNVDAGKVSWAEWIHDNDDSGRGILFWIEPAS